MYVICNRYVTVKERLDLSTAVKGPVGIVRKPKVGFRSLFSDLASHASIRC